MPCNAVPISQTLLIHPPLCLPYMRALPYNSCLQSMIAAEVDKFYRQVIKDFIHSLGKNEYIVRELQQQNIFLNQIEQSMLEKLQDPTRLFKRLTFGYNQIEKEMMSRYATVEEIIYNQRKNRLSSHSRSCAPSLPSESLHDDLECYSDNASKDIDSKNEEEAREVEKSDEQSLNSEKRRLSSEFSLDDLSDFDGEYGDTVKRLRQNAKIHILGTYDSHSKKHDFKRDKTEIVLDNVFIKVEGVAKEIFLKKLHCVSRKRVHQ